MSVFTLPSMQNQHMEDRTFKRSFMVSIIIHLLVLGAAGSMTLFRMNSITYSPSYTVDLVTLPGSPGPAASAPKASPPAQVAPSPKASPPAQVSKPEKPKTPAKKPETRAAAPVKPLEKAEEIKPSGGDEAAQAERRRRIEDLEQEARRLYDSFTTESSEPVETVDRSRGPAEDSAAQPPTVTGTGSGTGAGTGSGESTGGLAGRAAELRFQAYYDQIWGLIRYSWVLPEGVATGGKLLTVVGIRIAPGGDIEQYWIEKKSGNEYYDQSALRAIRKSSPLPALPKEFGNEPLEVGINFRYPE